MREAQKHRRNQLIVTCSVCVGASISLLWPDLSHASVAAGTIANFVWIWIE